MSVGFWIEIKSNQSVSGMYTPIATETVFTRYWKPASLSLGLRWIPLMQNGFNFSAEEIPMVLEELSKLREYIKTGSLQNVDESMNTFIVKRIDVLMSMLSDNKDDPSFRGAIG